MSSKKATGFVVLGTRHAALRETLAQTEHEVYNLQETVNSLREQIKYKDGQIDALKYAVNILARCAYWPELPSHYERPDR